jgi:hypothetical protein
MRRRTTTASGDKEEEQDEQGGGGYLFDAEDEKRKYMTYDRMESNGGNSFCGDLTINIK